MQVSKHSAARAIESCHAGGVRLEGRGWLHTLHYRCRRVPLDSGRWPPRCSVGVRARTSRAARGAPRAPSARARARPPRPPTALETAHTCTHNSVAIQKLSTRVFCIECPKSASVCPQRSSLVWSPVVQYAYPERAADARQRAPDLPVVDRRQLQYSTA